MRLLCSVPNPPGSSSHHTVAAPLAALSGPRAPATRSYWVDVLSVVPFYIEVPIRAGEDNDAALPDGVRILGLLRVLRILKLMRHYPDWRVLIVALKNSWRALLVPGFAMFITVLMLSGALFLAEGQR